MKNLSEGNIFFLMAKSQRNSKNPSSYFVLCKLKFNSYKNATLTTVINCVDLSTIPCTAIKRYPSCNYCCTFIKKSIKLTKHIRYQHFLNSDINFKVIKKMLKNN
jgi:hypothetical protein